MKKIIILIGKTFFKQYIWSWNLSQQNKYRKLRANRWIWAKMAAMEMEKGKLKRTRKPRGPYFSYLSSPTKLIPQRTLYSQNQSNRKRFLHDRDKVGASVLARKWTPSRINENILFTKSAITSECHNIFGWNKKHYFNEWLGQTMSLSILIFWESLWPKFYPKWSKLVQNALFPLFSEWFLVFLLKHSSKQ